MLIANALPISDSWHDHSKAIGLGLATIGAGFSLAEIYQRPGLAYAGTILGVLLTVAHWDHAKWSKETP